jgi:hypothetical protein
MPQQVHLFRRSLEDLDGFHRHKPGLFIGSGLVAPTDPDGAVKNLACLPFVPIVVDTADSALIPGSPDLKAQGIQINLPHYPLEGISPPEALP